MTKAVPPPLPAPRRSLTPPAQRSLRESGAFTLESATPARSKEMAVYQAMLSILDPLPLAERMELVELARAFVQLSPAERKLLLDGIS